MKNSAESIALPDFELPLVYCEHDHLQTQPINLSTWVQEQQQGLILYFYPKDNTQGCSIQAEDFTHKKQQLQQLGYQVIGVSRDGIKSHQNFISKKSLQIGLISDCNEQLCQHFDVIQEKMMYGKTHLGVVRSTFVFNKHGEMIGSFRNVKAKEHVDHLIDFLTNQE